MIEDEFTKIENEFSKTGSKRSDYLFKIRKFYKNRFDC